MALEQIGQKLKTAREGQGLTLAQIYERTKIPVNHLMAIDSGVVDDLPETIYVAGFIKRYAECVGLNGQSLADEFRREMTPSNGDNGHAGFSARAHAAQPILASPAYVQRARIGDDRPPSLLKSFFFPLVLIVCMLGGMAFLWNYNQTNHSDQQDTSLSSLKLPSSKFNQVQPSTAPTGPTQTGPTADGQPTPAANSEAQVSLMASQHVWVDVKAVSSGESLYTGFLEAGDRRDFKDSQGVRVHAGNGGSLTVMSEGKSQTLGAPGKIAEKAFMAANPSPTASALADGTKTAAGSGSILGANGKPTTVKKVVKKASADGAAKKRYRSVDGMPGGNYMPGEHIGGTRSIDVPYRYTDSGND